MSEANTQKLYIGCTIGPVFATLNKAKEPLEIWMASYLFSRIVQEIVAYLTKNPDITLISPSHRGIEKANMVKGVGLYSDHIFFSIVNADKSKAEELLDAAKKAALKVLAADIARSLSKDDTVIPEYTEKLCKAIYVLSIVHTSNEYESFPLHSMADELDLLECYPPYERLVDAHNCDLLEEYLISLSKNRSAWLSEHGIDNQHLNHLLRYNESTEQDGLDLKRYVALVQADGDYMGSLLGTLSKSKHTTLVSDISDFLFERGAENAQIVRDYGAMPIYFGGDDMLFLAPIKGNIEGKEVSLLGLIDQLEAKFEEAFEKMLGKIDEKKRAIFDNIFNACSKPALSFGVMICHCQYPLKLIREAAANALFLQAKNAEWTNERKKKAVHIELRKHSGQTSNLCMRAGTTDANAFSHFMKLEHAEIPTLSLHALHWKIMEQQRIVSYLLMIQDNEIRKMRLRSWLKHNFNETLPEQFDENDPENTHTQAVDPIVAFLCAIADDLWNNQCSNKGKEAAAQKIISNIDGAFRLLEFLSADDEKQEEGGANDGAVSV